LPTACPKRASSNCSRPSSLSSTATVAGAGARGDTPPYAVERELEDLDAIIRVAGEPVLLYGGS